MTDLPPDLKEQQRLKAAMQQLSLSNPFYFVLALYAAPEVVNGSYAGLPVQTACTDGKKLLFNSQFLQGLTMASIKKVLMHEVLHMAHQHVSRVQKRDPKLFNMAADYYVNDAIGFADLPPGALRMEGASQYSVEEIYEMLLRDPPPASETLALSGDLHYQPLPDTDNSGDSGAAENQENAISPAQLFEQQKETAAYWQQALERAATQARLQGNMPWSQECLVGHHARQVNWRAALWDYVDLSRSDFAGLNLALLPHGLATEDLQQEHLQCDVCIDTSGSVSGQELSQFMSEVQAIQEAYPGVQMTLYYADCDLHGPYELSSKDTLPPPRGGGGTDFRPFFKASTESTVRLYLTDGYGVFPQDVPDETTLWVVTPGGLLTREFPFGQVIRLV